MIGDIELEKEFYAGFHEYFSIDRVVCSDEKLIDKFYDLFYNTQYIVVYSPFPWLFNIYLYNIYKDEELANLLYKYRDIITEYKDRISEYYFNLLKKLELNKIIIELSNTLFIYYDLIIDDKYHRVIKDFTKDKIKVNTLEFLEFLENNIKFKHGIYLGKPSGRIYDTATNKVLLELFFEKHIAKIDIGRVNLSNDVINREKVKELQESLKDYIKALII